MSTLTQAYYTYSIDKAAHDATHPFDLFTAFNAPTFREITAQERAGALESEHGIVKALFMLLRTADERGLTDTERQVMWALYAAHLEPRDTVIAEVTRLFNEATIEVPSAQDIGNCFTASFKPEYDVKQFAAWIFDRLCSEAGQGDN